ncbi:recombination mediator RecR [Patescibacteria group bacterium]|nr:recombination mediator RecR [Patescibacteria group bacterium]MBU1931617.1 recombination mediator RecR [Patescibacteria group bacterium]
MKLPVAIQRLINSLEKLPGIGPKTAQRLTFYLLNVPQTELDTFGQAVSGLKKNTHICPLCFNVDELEPCSICQDRSRNQTVICVIEQPLDILAIEKTEAFNGLYHVLGGVIDPLNNIGPDELHINELPLRLKNSQVKEVILATNPTMEGEATAMYLQKLINEKLGTAIKLTRIGRGLPTGADLEYADAATLLKALEGRREY